MNALNYGDLSFHMQNKLNIYSEFSKTDPQFFCWEMS